MLQSHMTKGVGGAGAMIIGVSIQSLVVRAKELVSMDDSKEQHRLTTFSHK